jgi:hypothetical protein
VIFTTVGRTVTEDIETLITETKQVIILKTRKKEKKSTAQILKKL